MNFRNGILQAVVLGKDTKAKNESLVDYLDKLSEKIKSESNRVFEMSEDGDKYTPYVDLQEYSILFSNTSLCNFTPSLQGK